MDGSFTEREERAYEQLWKSRESDNYEECSFAFDCMGLLGNECLCITLDERLDFVERMFEQYIEKKRFADLE